ncbi:flavoprotein [Sodalis praecaptivus]|uniref:flavoprotein n=1 Tax=Sodalis TaxID=84565 RepID=UPI00046CC229|nr:flavoprotein [Sodalis praecaptivus]
MSQRQRLIVGISGASGALYGVRALALLRRCQVKTHRVVSRAGMLTVQHALALTRQALHAQAGATP